MQRKFYLLLSISFGLTLAISLLLALHPAPVAAKAIPGTGEVIQAGLAYLQAQQQPDGGILGLSSGSDPDTTARTVLAFITSGQPLSGVVSADGKSMLDYLAAQAISYTHETTGTLFPSRAGLLLSAVAVADGDPSNFGGMDLLGELQASFHPDTGAYSTTAQQGYSSGAASDLSQAWAILGISLAGQSVPVTATQYLSNTQAPDGSWGFSDPDTTALAVTALLASRQVTADQSMIQNALGFFHTNQLDSGGWRPSWDTDPLNADSTGWILQALFSVGEDPTGSNWTNIQGNPVDALTSLQKTDGAIGGTYANPYSTADAIIGLNGQPLLNLAIPQTGHRAGLAVFFGDGSVYTACVSFNGSSLSGTELLKQSGVPFTSATDPNQGSAVCSIDAIGCPPNDCFCSMPNYWSFWQPGENGWVYSVAGADQSQVENGAVQAWSWGSGNPPPQITFKNICESAPLEVALSQPTATLTSVPPINTPQPSQTPANSAPTATSQSAPTAGGTQGNLATYLVFAAIVIILGLGIFFVVRSRSR
jgi:hypothetical protein